MKKIIIILFGAAFIVSCNSKKNNSAVSDAKEVQKQLTEMRPGSIPTTDGGWTMTAKINGKPWKATSMYDPESAGRIVGDNNGEGFGLPFDRRDMVVGNKTTFSHDNAVDLSTFEGENMEFWGGYKGEMEITKVDAKSAEGRFVVTGTMTDSDKKVEITDGFFRIYFTK